VGAALVKIYIFGVSMHMEAPKIFVKDIKWMLEKEIADKITVIN
jgi:hypothetical protein